MARDANAKVLFLDTMYSIVSVYRVCHWIKIVNCEEQYHVHAEIAITARNVFVRI